MKSDYQNNIIVLRGAGEMASGVIHRLYKSGYKVIALEQSNPVCVRRLVCFANAIYENEFTVEGVRSVFVNSIDDALMTVEKNIVPILEDPDCQTIDRIKPVALIDCRMLKKDVQLKKFLAPVVIGLGPGFEAKVNCHAVIETNRGEDLGKVILSGKAEDYTGIPAEVNDFTYERVLRSLSNGNFISHVKIGDIVKSASVTGKVNDVKVVSQIDGVVRGLIHECVIVKKGQKIGDIDPSGNKELCDKISDKARAIADGVLEAISYFSVKN